jgi:DNA-binding protein Fis
MVIEKTKEFKNSISALDLRIQKIEKELGIDKKEKEIKLDSFVYKNNLFEMNKKIFENISEVKSTFITDLLKGDVGQLKLQIERKLTSASMAFEFVFQQLNEMGKNTSLFYNDIKPFIYGFYKLTDDDAVKSIKKLLEEKISKGAIYSKYYEALKKFLFGNDGKTPNQIFEIILSDEERINIEYLFQFTDVLEKNYDIANIECKYDGAILFVLNDMMNFDDLCSLLTIAKTVNTRNEEIIKTMIICLNKKNLDSYRKNYLKTNGKNNDYSINKKNKNY